MTQSQENQSKNQKEHQKLSSKEIKIITLILIISLLTNIFLLFQNHNQTTRWLKCEIKKDKLTMQESNFKFGIKYNGTIEYEPTRSRTNSSTI